MMPHVLSRIPILAKFVDERFLDHRRRSTSAGGIVAVLVAVGLFEYRYFHDHFISWDLIAVAFTMVIVKLCMMLWYRFNG
jgi:protein-S-isoprenylcysteine O-methyltransferase Ste14